MQTYDNSHSEALFKRAKSVIPGGIYGHYAGTNHRRAPRFFSRSEGAHFWDVDGNRYIDFMCAYGPMILGYNHPEVDAAAQAQYREGNTVSLAAPVMVELAETIVDMVDSAEWALFGKNGGDSTGLAVRIARAATGRNKIVKVEDGYHGVVPWMMATTDDPRTNTGTIREDAAHVLQVPWNDASAFEDQISAYPGDIACFISSPYDHPVMRDNTLPADGYWARIEQLCRKHGIVLIIDEVRSGFRVHPKGAHLSYGFTPDMVCFGKALGNGYPISALVGSDALKQAATDVFYTGTQFFNAAPMAAAKATLEALQDGAATEHMTQFGTALNEGLVNIAAQQGFELIASGIPAMPYYRLNNVSTETHFQWIDECVARGAYLLGYHNHFISAAHSQEDLQETFAIANSAFSALREQMD
ncbi:MAG: aminotransferase class III-fold pyridoxal phosphate-dependent enzyme [Pseudomonadota bacterium]